MLLQTMKENGIYITDDWNEPLDFDSITFISTIVCIENSLGFEIPDEYLLFEKFQTFQMYVDNISEIEANHKKEIRKGGESI